MARRPTRVYDVALPAHAKEEFWARGFTDIAQITSEEEIEWLRDVYDALFGGDVENTYVVRDVMTRIDEQRGERISQIIRPETSLPDMTKTQFWQNSIRLGSELLDVPMAQMEGWGHMVRKAPNDSEAIPWHQDEAFWDPSFDYRALGVWMPLDPATLETGCMDMVPGSHEWGIIPHKLGQDDPAVTYIEAVKPDVSKAVPRPVPVGGASLHHCRTLHGSGPNVSGNVRRAWITEAQMVPVKRETPHDRAWYWKRHEAMMELARPRMPAAVPLPAE
jgi:hypothetical protein